MGACYESIELDGSLTREQLKVRFSDYQSDCATESGNSYSGRLNMCRGLKIHDRVFSSVQQADEFIDSIADKWEEAHAVKVTVSTLTREELEAHRPYNALMVQYNEKLIALSALGLPSHPQTHVTDFFKRDIRAKAFLHVTAGKAMHSCNTCGSRLAAKYLRSATCLVCGTTEGLMTPAIEKKVNAQEAKVLKTLGSFQDKFKKIENDLQAKKPKKTFWLIGGLCAS